MVAGYTKVQDKEKRLIIAHYINGNSMNNCAKKFNRSISTISKIVSESKDTDFENFSMKVETVKKRNTADVLATLLADDTIEIINKYKAVLVKDKNIQQALEGKYKIQPFTNAIGMFLDKALAYQKMQGDRNDLSEASTNLMDILKVALEKNTNV